MQEENTGRGYLAGMSDYGFSFPDPSAKLNEFEDYGDFIKYSKSLFNLGPDEHKALFSVLLKLESVGESASQSMLSWKKRMDNSECEEFIRFMIYVDSMEPEEQIG